MSSDDPYMRLPEHIELALAEAGELLEVLDVAVINARTDEERSAARDAAEMITTKLWPKLGDLLDDDEAWAETMTTRLIHDGIRSPEAAERLVIRGRDVYMMLFDGGSDGTRRPRVPRRGLDRPVPRAPRLRRGARDF